MRILLVAHAFPPDAIGGTERYAEAIGHGLMHRGHEVRVFCGSLEWRERFAVEREERDGLTVTRVHRHDLYFDHWDKLSNPHVANAFEDELDLFRPDVLHLQHWIRLTHDLVRRAAARSIPTLVHLHDLFASCPRVFRLRPARAAGAGSDELEFCEQAFVNDACRPCVPRWTFQSDGEIDRSLDHYRRSVQDELAAATARLALSASQRREVMRFSPRPDLDYEVLQHPWIPGAVDLAGTDAHSPAGRLRLLYFSSVAPIKGTHVLLEALRRLGADGRSSGVSLDVHGAFANPAYEARLRELAAGLEVRFHGPYARNEPCRTPADVVVISSLAHETWSLWLDEAARTGLPILAAASGAIAERATGRMRLYPAADAGALATAIAELRDDPLRRHVLAAAPAPTSMTLEAHLVALEMRLEAVRRKGARATVVRMERPSAEWIHEWERRELAFRELLRSEGWERVLGEQHAQLERLKSELAQARAADGGNERA
ncbi:MAG: glycosyltransferase [Planctomycetota bacterium]